MKNYEMIQATINAIIETINSTEYEAYGLRIDRRGLEPGYSFPVSHRLLQDDPEDGTPYDPETGYWNGGELAGTSVIGISYADEVDVEDALAMIDTYMYPSQALYLVGGTFEEFGEDIGEHVLSDAELITRIEW